MAVDRERRDALAKLLLQFLRSEISHREFHRSCEGIFQPTAHPSIQDQGIQGFPVLMGGTDEQVIDGVLDGHVARTIWSSAPGMYSRKKSARTIAQQELIRTLALLRSNLDENDLVLPRRPVVQRFALLNLALLSGAAFFGTIFSTAFTVDFIGLPPICLAMWPISGVLLLWKHSILIRPSLTDDPKSRPFLTLAQYEKNSSLVIGHFRGAVLTNPRPSTAQSACARVQA